MFLSKPLTELGEKLNTGVKAFPDDEINGCIDALGLPFGFQYSRQFLFKAFELLPSVEKTPDEGYSVPSESDPSNVYNVSLNPLSCECPAFHRFKMAFHPFCKHIAAALLKDQDVSGMPFEEFMDRWDDGNYKWRPAEGGKQTGNNDELEPDAPGLVSMIFSSGQLDTYTRCPAQYYFGWVARVPSNGAVNSSLVFDRAMKATIYAEKGYEPDREVPLEDKWRPEIDIAVDSFHDGKPLDGIFTETFKWLSENVSVEWNESNEFDEMLLRGSTLANLFSEEFHELKAKPLVNLRCSMIDKETGLIVKSNGMPAVLQSIFDLIGDDGTIYKLKTSSKSISKMTDDWSMDLQRYVYEQIYEKSPAGLKVINLVRTKKPKMQVLDALEPKLSRTLAICSSVIASINAFSFYPNPKNVYGCAKCDYLEACDEKW